MLAYPISQYGSDFFVESKGKGYKAGKRESFIHSIGIDNGDLYLEDNFTPDEHVIGEAGQGFKRAVGNNFLK